MTAMPECEKVLLVQAELDGELDAAQAAALAAHRVGCAVCQAASTELARARALIGADLYEPMPADSRSRVLAQIAAGRQPQSAHSPGGVGILARSFSRTGDGWGHGWWRSIASFGLGAACAAVLGFLVLVPAEPGIVDQVVASHIRALQPGHLADVESSDRHTVKPWFDGRIDFAPPVKDLAAARFPVKGGRLDYVGGRPVAALVYQRDKHIINLYIWPTAAGAEALPKAADRQGYNLVHWIANGMTLWAVSDLEANQLREFTEEWRQSP